MEKQPYRDVLMQQCLCVCVCNKLTTFILITRFSCDLMPHDKVRLHSNRHQSIHTQRIWCVGDEMRQNENTFIYLMHQDTDFGLLNRIKERKREEWHNRILCARYHFSSIYRVLCEWMWCMHTRVSYRRRMRWCRVEHSYDLMAPKIMDPYSHLMTPPA